MVKNSPVMQGMQVWFLDRKDSLEKGVTTHCCILAWENPMDRGASWAIVHGGHNSVRHDLATKQQQNFILIYGGLLRWLSGKESACPCRRHRVGLIPGLGRSCKGGNDNPLQYSCLRKFHGQRSLAGYSPWVTKSQTWLSNWAHMPINIYITPPLSIHS